ncbi:MAG: hypothetical protein VR65_05380 [Desulfobulbaceae bacterium BRH_c16a]|nr:MAG: hypothetical protein VR65_05380 [Desulfobulbaceae bacterium BRH_c16a]
MFGGENKIRRQNLCNVIGAESLEAGTSGIFPVADGDYFTIEIFKKFRQFSFGIFYHIGDLHVI